MLLRKFILRLGLGLFLLSLSEIASAQSTAFTYQGRLTVGGVVTNGSYDLKFALYDAATTGSPVGIALTNAQTAVSNGVFIAALDFGPGVFNGSDRWLQVGVRPGGSNSWAFTMLTPRQKITPTAYALYAQNAGSVNAGTVVASNSTTLGGTIQFAGNSVAPGYVWVATDSNGTGQWQPAPNSFNPTNLTLYNSEANSAVLTFENNAAYAPGLTNYLALGYIGMFANSNNYNGWPEPRPDQYFGLGFNKNGTGAVVRTNVASYGINFESAWMNYPNLIQSEFYLDYTFPYTNFNIRPFYFNFPRSTNTIPSLVSPQVNGGILADEFNFGNFDNGTPQAIRITVSRGANASAGVTVRGSMEFKASADNYGYITMNDGGQINFKNQANNRYSSFGYALYDNNTFGFDGAQNPAVFYNYSSFRFRPWQTNNVGLIIQPINTDHAADLLQFNRENGLPLAKVDAAGNGYFSNFRSGVTNIGGGTTLTINFSAPMATTNYSVVVTPEFSTGGAGWWVSDKSTNGFNFNLSTSTAGGNLSWQAMLIQ